MAAHDYYNQPYRSTFDYREDDQIPTPPTAQPSPYDDLSHSNSHSRFSVSQPSPYEYAESQSELLPHHGDIPLRDYKSKHDSMAAPMVGGGAGADYDDPFVRDAKPRRPRPVRQATEPGWFRGKITWVCFACTLVQVAVFLAEIIRNGMNGHEQMYRRIWLTCYSYLDGNTNRDTSTVQSNDWAFSVPSNQHGRSLRTVHAHHAKRSELFSPHSMALSKCDFDNRQ